MTFIISSVFWHEKSSTRFLPTQHILRAFLLGKIVITLRTPGKKTVFFGGGRHHSPAGRVLRSKSYDGNNNITLHYAQCTFYYRVRSNNNNNDGNKNNNM